MHHSKGLKKIIVNEPIPIHVSICVGDKSGYHRPRNILLIDNQSIYIYKLTTE